MEPPTTSSLMEMSVATCTNPPPVVLLMITLLMTISATAMLCGAVMTDHWEVIQWDRGSVEAKITNSTHNRLHWFLGGRVAKIRYGNVDNIFLVPMHGGIWTLCIDLTAREMNELAGHGFRAKVKCVSYLTESVEVLRREQLRYEYQHIDYQYSPHPNLRMQNLSISCSLVCLIILGSAALLGAFGVCQRQISAILVTGVMYLLAALFALFTLMIIHFKRHQRRPLQESDFNGTFDGIVSPPGSGRAAQHLLNARQFSTSWSLDLGWCGVVFCGITYVLWIMLSKIMRYNPLSALLI